MKQTSRLSNFTTISDELSLLTDQRLMDLLAANKSALVSIGGTTLSLGLGGTPIFIKKIRLTDLELLPENRMSTANLFGLPFHCHYGVGLIGTPGFGAWRELAAHIKTSNWVIAGACSHFPLLYHWRILPASSSESCSEGIEDAVAYWENSLAIRTRLETVQKSSSELVLFLEFFPENLHQWFDRQIKSGAELTAKGIAMIEHDLIAITSFLSSRGFVHFDAHFRNIMTDGKKLYLSDFGLAASEEFQLSQSENEFLKVHNHYDLYLSITNMVNVLIQAAAKEEHEVTLNDYINGKIGEHSDSSQIIKKYAPIAALMNKFYVEFKGKISKAAFPAEELERAFSSLEHLRR